MDDADLEALARMRASTIAARTRPAPVLIVDDLLSVDLHDEVLTSLIALESEFWSNRTAGRDALVIVDPPCVAPVVDAIRRRFDEFVDALGTLGAPLDGLDACRLEAPAVSASGSRSFHAPHIDNDPASGVEMVVTRRVSFVWHAFRSPNAFEGGELRIWDHAEVASPRGPWTPGATWTDHPCRDNQLLVFSSSSLHEVLPVRMSDGPFADRRFAVITAAHAA